MKSSSLNLSLVTNRLSDEWNDIPDGFFYKIRNGIMDYERYATVLDILFMARNIIKNCESEMIDRECVKYIWFIPLFLSWQKERVCIESKNTAHEFSSWCSEIEKLVGEILGEP